MKTQKLKISKYKLFILLLFFFIGCNNNSNNKVKSVLKDKQEKVEIKQHNFNNISKEINLKNNQDKSINFSCDDCLLVLDSLIRTSSSNKKFIKDINKNYVINVDEATKEKVTIKIMLDSSDNIPLSWLELDLIENKLFDTTNDDLNPELIVIDENILKNFKLNCLKCCLD